MDYAMQIDKVLVDSGTGDQRMLVAKMSLLQDLVKKHKIDDNKYDQKKLSRFGMRYLDHGDSDVKLNGYLTLLR